MSLHIVRKVTLNKSSKLIETIYSNFEDLTEYPELKHTRTELARLITSPNAKLVFIMVNNKIAAYLIGESMELNDGRRVFYVNYIFTSKMHRKQGFASKLMEYIEELSKQFGYDGVLLTCDTENEDVHNFYLMRGYMADLFLRQYKKHDVLYKKI